MNNSNSLIVFACVRCNQTLAHYTWTLNTTYSTGFVPYWRLPGGVTVCLAAFAETQLRCRKRSCAQLVQLRAANAASASRAPIRSTIGSIKAQWTIYWTQVTQQAQPAQPAQLVQLRAANAASAASAARAPIRSTIGSMGPQKPNEQYIERRWRSRRSQRSWCSCAQPTQPAQPELQFEVL